MSESRIFISGTVKDFDVRLAEADEAKRKKGFPLILKLEPDNEEYRRARQLFFLIPYQDLFMAVFRFCTVFNNKVELVVEGFSFTGKPSGTVVGAAEHRSFKHQR
jgi:hypothetical protein